MQKHKNKIFGAAVLTLALVFGAATSYWLPDSATYAAPEVQTTQANNIPLEVLDIIPSQATLVELYNQAAPSVVNIRVTAEREAQQAPAIPGFPFGGQDQSPAPVQGQGTGWMYDNEGHIVTNNHVVEGATKMTVYFGNGMWADAELVATDPQADLAVIKVTPPEGIEWRPLPLAAANSAFVGYYVAALGSPFGLEETMTVGVISALGRSVPTDQQPGASSYSLPDVIQTDTAINPGNSGGPLLNLNGEVVGVNFAINTTSGSNSGVGFAIPVSVVEKVVPALIQEGKFNYAYLGISGTSVDEVVAEEENLPDNQLGVYVAQAVDGGPAATGGIQTGDIVQAIDGQPVTAFEDLISYLFQSTQPGQTVTLTVLRNGELMEVDVTLEARPAAMAASPATSGDVAVSIADAIRTAKEAVMDAGLMETVESANAKMDTQNGTAVWVVTLTGTESSAVVTVDANTGEVLELDVR
jgi:2-alkenal reductase